jgi:hypothetical protein
MTEDQNTTCYALSEDCLAPAPNRLTVADFATVIMEKVIKSDSKGLQLTFYASITPARVWFELSDDGGILDRYRDLEEAIHGWNDHADV